VFLYSNPVITITAKNLKGADPAQLGSRSDRESLSAIDRPQKTATVGSLLRSKASP